MEYVKYLDESLPDKERAADLVSRMTLEEKASQLKYDASAVERLGIPSYNWWNEALHGVARAGTATMFPQAIALAAMFDDVLLEKIADVISTEGRAKYNQYTKKGDRAIYKGLTYWSPNVNIFRDPRWGRGHETYGEDPFLSSRLGVAFVKGIQGKGKRLKAAACAKHFAVHSGPEHNRHSFNAVVSKKDMYETYLPAFEACVKEAKVESVMGAYNRTNGEPCCGSKTLLKDILRGKWKFDGHVVSDCGALGDFHYHHLVTKSFEESAALALTNGCDLNCGGTYLYVLSALEKGLITEEDIDRSVTRLMTTRIRLGMFDKQCEYDSIPYAANDCQAHKDMALEASKKAMVLLKNNGLLPLDKEKLSTIAVIGPNANSRSVLKGNYEGVPSRYVTLLEGIQNYVGGDVRVEYAMGSPLYLNPVEGQEPYNEYLSEAIICAEEADVAILCLGLDPSMEGEEGDAHNPYGSGDKATLDLPPCQEELLRKVVETGTPTVLILANGSALSVNYADEHCDAILEAWYSGQQGGDAAASILFGECSPSGKLPVTFYRSTEELPDFEDYAMKNRTYRYMEKEALYPFGYGLTYGKAAVTDLQAPEQVREGESLTVQVTIENQSDVEMEEVVQLYIKHNGTPYAVRNHSLCGFQRVSLPAHSSKTVTLTIRPESFPVVNEDGDRVFDAKSATLFAGIGQPDARTEQLTGTKAVKAEILYIK